MHCKVYSCAGVVQDKTMTQVFGVAYNKIDPCQRLYVVHHSKTHVMEFNVNYK